MTPPGDIPPERTHHARDRNEPAIIHQTVEIHQNLEAKSCPEETESDTYGDDLSRAGLTQGDEAGDRPGLVLQSLVSERDKYCSCHLELN